MRVGTVAPLFCLSGAVAIACETAWARGLALVLGAGHVATGVVLGAFMGGLALGGEVGARIADAQRRPLRAYALAEAIVALAAMASPFALRAAAEGPALPFGVMVAAVFVATAVPTLAMGATLPLLVAAVARSREGLQRPLAALYAVNLAGGVAGALVMGLVALPALGARRALLATAAIAALTAATAAALDNRSAPREPVAWSAAEAPGAPGVIPFAMALGVLSFVLQVAHNRVFALLFGSAAYTFALVLATILGALALGGARAVRAAKEPGPPWPMIARRCLALAVWTFVGILAVRAAPFPLAATAASPTARRALYAALLAVVAGVPAFQIGALFPALAAHFPARGAGRAAGRAVLAATVGNLVGALGASFVLLPRLGLRHTLVAASAAALALACAAAYRAGTAHFLGTVAAAALACALGGALGTGWDAASLSAGTFRIAAYRERLREPLSTTAPCGPAREVQGNRVLFEEDGASGTVVVLGHPAGDDCSLYSLRVSGKAEGSVYVRAPLAARVPAEAPRVPAGDLPTQRLAGLLPAVAAARRGHAFLVGWGTGTTARAMLEAGVQDLHAAEIEPAILRAARLFDEPLLGDPRVHLELGDARALLRRARPGAYDVIVSQPSNPWVVGSSALFSRELFALARSRLASGGRALVWVQLYEIDRDTVRSLVRTFLDAFPDAHALRPGHAARDLLLLGGHDAPPLDVAALEALGAVHLADAAGLARYAGDAPASTDDDARIELQVADALLAGRTRPVEELLLGMGPARP